jgi:hypothetical protein
MIIKRIFISVFCLVCLLVTSADRHPNHTIVALGQSKEMTSARISNCDTDIAGRFSEVIGLPKTLQSRQVMDFGECTAR